MLTLTFGHTTAVRQTEEARAAIAVSLALRRRHASGGVAQFGAGIDTAFDLIHGALQGAVSGGYARAVQSPLLTVRTVAIFHALTRPHATRCVTIFGARNNAPLYRTLRTHQRTFILGNAGAIGRQFRAVRTIAALFAFARSHAARGVTVLRTRNYTVGHQAVLARWRRTVYRALTHAVDKKQSGRAPAFVFTVLRRRATIRRRLTVLFALEAAPVLLISRTLGRPGGTF